MKTLGSNFDTLLAVYTGPVVSGLTEVASNDDASSGGYFTSEVSLGAVVRVSYFVALEAVGDAGGNYVLGWELVPATPPVPRITEHPPSRTQLPGTRVELRVGAANADSFEWRFNGAFLPGAIGRPLVLPALTSGPGGGGGVKH